MAVFSYSNPRVIHWGAGSVAHLQAELERLHEKPELLSAFIRHAKVPIRLRVSSR